MTVEKNLLSRKIMFPFLSMSEIVQELSRPPEQSQRVTLILGPATAELSRMREREILTDVVFQVGPRRIPAHKVIVAGSSDYFQGLFTTTMREAGQSTVTIRDVSPQIFEQFIQSIYGQPIEITDWRTGLEFYRLTRLYLVRQEILPQLSQLEVPQEDFVEFSRQVLEQNPELTQEIIDLIASQLRYNVDLSDFSDEFIGALLASPSYFQDDPRTTYQIIDRLVKAGRDSNLYNLLDFNRIPWNQRNRLPRSFVLRRTTGEYLPGDVNLTPDVPAVIFSGRPFVAVPIQVYMDYEYEEEYTNAPTGAILRVPRNLSDPESITLEALNGPYDTVRALFGGRPSPTLNINLPIVVDRYEVQTETRAATPYPYVRILEWHPYQTPGLPPLTQSLFPSLPASLGQMQLPGFRAWPALPALGGGPQFPQLPQGQQGTPQFPQLPQGQQGAPQFPQLPQGQQGAPQFPQLPQGQQGTPQLPQGLPRV